MLMISMIFLHSQVHKTKAITFTFFYFLRSSYQSVFTAWSHFTTRIKPILLFYFQSSQRIDLKSYRVIRFPHSSLQITRGNMYKAILIPLPFRDEEAPAEKDDAISRGSRGSKHLYESTSFTQHGYVMFFCNSAWAVRWLVLINDVKSMLTFFDSCIKKINDFMMTEKKTY
jgi:hypothetical protein